MSATAAVAQRPVSGSWRCLWEAGAELGEGALWSPRLQALWWVDILGRRLHQCDAQGQSRRSWQLDEEVSAVAEGRGERLLLALRRGFARFAPFEAEAIPRYLHCPRQELPGNRFNDGKCDPQGRFWAGSMDFDAVAPTGTLYRFDADARCTPQDSGFPVCNGPAWSLDGRTLYFNDTVGARTLSYDFDPVSGGVSGRRVWREWDRDAEGLPDGMTTDAEGCLWIAHWGGSSVTRHDPVGGELLARIELPVTQVTSCAFGGPQLRTLFITSAAVGLDAAQRAAQPLAGGLFAVDVDVAGLPAAVYGGAP